MVVFPHAKINLGLQVIEKRHDGYHNIVSCLYPISWCDVLEILPSSAFSFETSGLPITGTGENLCVKAYKLLRNEFDLPAVTMYLHKIIPMGAGLGGGSSDAAYTLVALAALFNLPLSREDLGKYAAQLGTDCPFFLEERSALARDKGDNLTPFNPALSPGYLAVVYPGVHVNTTRAYAALQAKTASVDIEKLLKSPDLSKWKQQLYNDFEPSVFAQFPQIEELKQTLYQSGAEYASMSGSGASVYGIFPHRPNLERIPENYTIWVQKLIPDG